jgi:hypothetical protein
LTLGLNKTNTRCGQVGIFIGEHTHGAYTHSHCLALAFSNSCSGHGLHLCRFLMSCRLYVKCIILPRQAWDKHRENSLVCELLLLQDSRRRTSVRSLNSFAFTLTCLHHLQPYTGQWLPLEHRRAVDRCATRPDLAPFSQTKNHPFAKIGSGRHRIKNSKPKRWRFPQVYAPELFAAEGNVATVPGFVAVPTRIAELSAQLAASRQDLSVDAMKQKLRKLLGLPVELPHELAHYRILRCDSNRTPACMHALRGMLQSTARRN